MDVRGRHTNESAHQISGLQSNICHSICSMRSRTARPNKRVVWQTLPSGMKVYWDNELLPVLLQVLAKDDCKIKLMKSGNRDKC